MMLRPTEGYYINLYEEISRLLTDVGRCTEHIREVLIADSGDHLVRTDPATFLENARRIALYIGPDIGSIRPIRIRGDGFEIYDTVEYPIEDCPVRLLRCIRIRDPEIGEEPPSTATPCYYTKGLSEEALSRCLDMDEIERLASMIASCHPVETVEAFESEDPVLGDRPIIGYRCRIGHGYGFQRELS